MVPESDVKCTYENLLVRKEDQKNKTCCSTLPKSCSKLVVRTFVYAGVEGCSSSSPVSRTEGRPQEREGKLNTRYKVSSDATLETFYVVDG